MSSDRSAHRTDVVYTGSFLKIRREIHTDARGQERPYEFVDHPGGAAVIAVDEEDRIYLVRQWRQGLSQEFLEIPAGKIDPGEPPLQTAQRELREETGLTARQWSSLGVIHPCIGYSNEVIHLYLAEGLDAGTASPDEDEHLVPCILPVITLFQQVDQGQITDGKTLSALLLYRSHRNRKRNEGGEPCRSPRE